MKKVYHIVKSAETGGMSKMDENDFRFGTPAYTTIAKVGKFIEKRVSPDNGHLYRVHQVGDDVYGIYMADFSAFKI